MSDKWTGEREASREPITELPEGYPAYCIFVPSGFDDDFERLVFEKLFTWGKSMGKNVFVAPWNTKDPAYIELIEALKGENFRRRPAIVLTDSNKIQSDSFKMIIDDQKLMTTKANELTVLLPGIVDQLFMGQGEKSKKMIKNALRQNKLEDIISQLKFTLGTTANSILDRGHVFSMGPCTLEIPSKSK